MPFATGGDPAQQKFMVEGVVSPGLDDQQQEKRRTLLHKLNTLGSVLKDNAALAAYDQAEDQAYDMILGDGAKAFDLSQETDEVRKRYDVNWAPGLPHAVRPELPGGRRLVQRGVPYITINFGGWDSHTDNFKAMRNCCRTWTRPGDAPGRAVGHGLLDSTIVWCCGEFGRTPRSTGSALERRPQPLRQGLLRTRAGGGFKGGRVVGSSDAKGKRSGTARSTRATPRSIYELMGIDPEGQLPNPLGLH